MTVPLVPYVADADLTLYVGDAATVLRELPSESVHCCVTSPPFYGLRDYGTGTWEGGAPVFFVEYEEGYEPFSPHDAIRALVAEVQRLRRLAEETDG